MLCLGLACQTVSFAQGVCGFDEAHQQLLTTHPDYARSITENHQGWADFTSAASKAMSNGLVTMTPGGPVYEIPVVVHVIHTGGAVGSNYNPSSAQLSGMIDYLTKVYEATWTGYPDSLSGGTHFPVKFVLAKRDPNCNPTDGIIRVNGSSLPGYASGGVNRHLSSGASDPDVKALSRWPNTDYVNIWVVNKIDGADGFGFGSYIAGYAYFPGAPANVDGVILLAKEAKSGSTTLPHELGHSFGLWHTFQGGTETSCPPNANCNTQGDEVCDTDPHMNTFACPTGNNPCTGNSWSPVKHNIMSYTNCPDRFSAGQRTKWLWNLMNNRPGLMSSMGSVAPMTMTEAACSPASANPSNTFDVGPRLVKLNDLYGATNGGYNSDGNKVWLDKSCHQAAHLDLGASYTLSVTSSFQPEKVAVYIDWNNNGSFEGSELVYTHAGSTYNEVHTTTITVPVSGVVTCAPLRMRVLADRLSAPMPTACGPLQYGQAEDYSIYVQGPSNSAQVAVLQNIGGNPSCFDDLLGFVPDTTGTALAATFQWFVNGSLAGTGNSYSSALLANGDVLTVKMYYAGPCGPDTAVSNPFTIIRQATVPPTATIALTGGTNPGCTGDTITFSATGTNTGSAPTWAWQVNGVAAGVTGPAYTTTALNSGDVVQVILTSNSACASPDTAVSNSITYTIAPAITPTVTASITNGNNPGCLDSFVTFTAVPTGISTTNTYQWLVNGNPVATGQNFTTNTLNNGDVVTVKLTTAGPGCRTTDVASSAGITMSLTEAGETPLISYIGNTLVSDVLNVQWYGPSGLIPGATGETYIPTEPGNYYAVNMDGGCGIVPSNVLNVSLLTVGTLTLEGLSIYPNPAKDRFTVSFSKAQDLTVKIYSLTGQLLRTSEIRGHQQKTLSVGDLPAATYFLLLQDEKGKSATYKITVRD